MPNDFKAVQRQTAQYDLFNRLHSISSDDESVREIAEHYSLPIVANQRCGTWYCDPSTSSSTYAYFKSTDGHTNNWAFNLRRSNLLFAEWAEKQGGVILVDSTRRGKRMPDALAKTVPIWCTVINRALGHERELYVPPRVVSPSEKAQIEEKLKGWVQALKSSTLPLPTLTHPLRPLFIHPSSSLPAVPPDCTPIICLSASRWVGSEDDVPKVTRLKGRTVGFSYVQGAGDDDELWSRGLTAALFYTHKDRLLEVDRDDLADVVDELVRNVPGIQADGLRDSEDGYRDISPETYTTGVPGPSSKLALSIGRPTTPSIWRSPAHTIRIVQIDKPKRGDPSVYRTPSSSIFACPSARSHPGAYTHALEALVDHVEDLLDDDLCIELRPGTSSQLDQVRTLHDGDDLTIADPILSQSDAMDARRLILPLALVLIVAIPDLAQPFFAGKQVDKSTIADVLHQLVALWPDGNPPRAALRRVNEYLMSRD